MQEIRWQMRAAGFPKRTQGFGAAGAGAGVAGAGVAGAGVAGAGVAGAGVAGAGVVGAGVPAAGAGAATGAEVCAAGAGMGARALLLTRFERFDGAAAAGLVTRSRTLEVRLREWWALSHDSRTHSVTKPMALYLVRFVRALPLPAPKRAAVVSAPKAAPIPASLRGS